MKKLISALLFVLICTPVMAENITATPQQAAQQERELIRQRKAYQKKLETEECARYNWKLSNRLCQRHLAYLKTLPEQNVANPTNIYDLINRF